MSTVGERIVSVKTGAPRADSLPRAEEPVCTITGIGDTTNHSEVLAEDVINPLAVILHPASHFHIRLFCRDRLLDKILLIVMEKAIDLVENAPLFLTCFKLTNFQPSYFRDQEQKHPCPP
ncbi:hypothetical protein BaRGS_00026173 [Batillaria attramentaria]|uniref:Uncharacterized protein n=1 Tax=Batillaria attramentaria TaxID=370345 RepID=A0ABD0K555_9CAEN